jgi:zinc transport system ATP-binding protein
MGISNIANKQIGEISGGQMQRALLCRAIISEPKLLILDEPTNFVDKQFESRLYDILSDLNHRMAIVMVSHDVKRVSNAVKSIVCINRTLHRHNSNTLTNSELEEYCGVKR